MKRMMMLGLVSLSACAGVVAAQDTVNHEFSEFTRWNDGSPYSGRCVVRVRTTSQHQLDGVLRIANDVWSERTGQGPLDIEIDRDSLGGLDAIGVPYDVLIDDLQAHADAHEREMVGVRRMQRDAGKMSFQRGGQVHDDAWFATYRTLDEITSYISNIEALRPDHATIDVIGQSIEGRDIRSITISGPDSAENPREDRPALFIFSTVHAREWIAPMTTSYIASRLVSDYETDTRVQMLLDNARVVIVPVANPDGYEYTWDVYRFWRKTRRDNGDGYFGVDINRNWSYRWGGEGSGNSTGSNTYRGEAPFSEPETRALRDAADALGDKLVAHIDYHSYGQLVLWPFGYESDVVTPEPFATDLDHLATCMTDTIRSTTDREYRPIQSVDLYPAAGDSSDWFFGQLGRASFTVELRTLSSFAPGSSQIEPCGIENYEAFKVLIEKTALTQRVLHARTPERELFDQLPVELHTFTDTGELSSASFTLHARSDPDGPFETYPMVSSLENIFAAELPEGACDQLIQYFFTVDDGSGDIIMVPDDDEVTYYETTLTARAYTFADRGERDDGWIIGVPEDDATSGIWARGVPEPTTHQPGQDRTWRGDACWVTDPVAGGDDEERDVDGGGTTLISPRFSAAPGATLSYWYWQVPSEERADINSVSISNDDGVTWANVPYLRSPLPGQWVRNTHLISDYVEPTSTMRLRFYVRDIRDDSTVELAIDDIAVGVPGCPANAADINADGQLNIFDITLFIEFFNAQSVSADYNGDSEINFFDVAEYLRIFTGQ